MLQIGEADFRRSRRERERERERDMAVRQKKLQQYFVV